MERGKPSSRRKGNAKATSGSSLSLSSVSPNACGSPEDLLLQMRNLVHTVLGEVARGGEISEAAKHRMWECSTRFISYITGEASEGFKRDCRQQLFVEHAIGALSASGLHDYVEPLSQVLNNREDEGGDFDPMSLINWEEFEKDMKNRSD